MKIELTFNELNTLFDKFSKSKMVLEPLLDKNAFALNTKVSFITIPLVLLFDSIIDGNKLIFSYKLPFGMNKVPDKLLSRIGSLIPNQVVDIDPKVIIVHLSQIKTIGSFFNHFSLENFSIEGVVVQIDVKRKKPTETDQREEKRRFVEERFINERGEIQ